MVHDLIGKYRRRWRNWAGSVEAVPNFRSYPQSLDQIQAEVLRAAEEGERLRVGGSGQSFTPLCWTDENLMSLDYFSGIESVDVETQRAWVRSGTTLQTLALELSERGLALDVLGSSGTQTLAGAISTGTHASGVRFGNMCTQVSALRMVMADGSVKVFSAAADKDAFDAARLSLGALGVITHVELQCVDAYRLRGQSTRSRLSGTLQRLDSLKNEHRHFEFSWMPYSDTVVLRTMDPTREPETLGSTSLAAKQSLIENGALWAASAMARHLPRRTPAERWLMTRGARNRDGIGEPYRRYETRRMVRFIETAYGVPAKHLPDVLAQMSRVIRGLNLAVHMPIEVRFVRADDIWLSPCYQRDSAMISLSAPKGVPFRPYFDAMSEIFDRYDGRPHWGKLHDKTSHDFAQLYPRYASFQRLRETFDPHGVFLNPHLSALMGIDRRY
ncbi:MAG: FAD-binding protein [Nevskiaceae bacterium]|nr:MAG: FAD-binding protein [Nevskiaceae bacterium]